MDNTRKRVRAFVEEFTQKLKEDPKNNELRLSHPFWEKLVRAIFNDDPLKYFKYEESLNGTRTDIWIPSTKVLIEQKSSNVDLHKEVKRKRGRERPFDQVRDYVEDFNRDEYPRYVVLSNFYTIEVYDLNNKAKKPEVFQLEKLETDYDELQFLINPEIYEVSIERNLSVKAGDTISDIYLELLKEYNDPTDPETLKSLNVLCTRLVFLFYADDAKVFKIKNQFVNYIKKFSDDPFEFRDHLVRLFKYLNTPYDKRDRYASKLLLDFPYINGGLFAEEIEIPRFNKAIIDLIIKDASELNWSNISPTIFGAAFESTINPETRRSGGMHYTSIENIHKVIDPLFLDDLKAELNKILSYVTKDARRDNLNKFINKLASLKFLDPACGSGNFLTETYISLRKLENEALQYLVGDQLYFGQFGSSTYDLIKVSINQFFGIEINDFAVSVAKTALWIAESQMMKETENIINASLDYLPLKSYTNIIEGNALRIDWNNLLPSSSCSYVIGNPPFIGARNKSKEQKKDVDFVFSKDWKKRGDLDYVACWFKKAIKYMKGTDIETGFVATSSIVQGDSISALWKPLMEKGIVINFAYQSFRWNNKARKNANVYVVIIGFSFKPRKKKLLFVDQKPKVVKNINAYLKDEVNYFLESRDYPLFYAPPIGLGNKAVDGGNYLFKEDEMRDFVKSEPKSEKYFKKWYGTTEYNLDKPRYCLFLGDVSGDEIVEMPLVEKRVRAVRDFRNSSSSLTTRRTAMTPQKFHITNTPDSDFIIVPRVTPRKHKYIIVGLLKKGSLGSDSVHIINTDDPLYFGILSSRLHCLWLKETGGAYGENPRYSKEIVYNNFPWITLSEKDKDSIRETAKMILNARNNHKKVNLKKMYSESMYLFPDLIKAHEANDRAVEKAYKIPKGASDEEIIKKLFKFYAEKANE